MGSAVIDLRNAIVAGKESLTQLLRKAKVIAACLSLDDVEKWVDLELKGYPDTVALPEYRHVFTQSVEIHNPFRGWQFAGHHHCRAPATQPVAEIEDLSKADELCVNLPERLPIVSPLAAVVPDPEVDALAHQWDQRATVSGAEFSRIVEAVKNELLNWTIELQKRGIKGEDMDFNDKEKQAATHQTFNIQKVIGPVGNVSNSQVVVTQIDQSIHIANSVTEKSEQATAIRQLENVLADEIGRKHPAGVELAHADKAAKSLRKAREELEDEEMPDPKRVLSWLEQAKYALKAFGLTKEIIDAGQKLEETFHLADWIGSLMS